MSGTRRVCAGYAIRQETAVTTNICEPCGRAFIASNCTQHCSVACCRRRSCPQARPARRSPARSFRTCVVCGRDNRRFPFERFAACDEGCERLILRGRQGLGATHMRVPYCQGVWMPGNEQAHHPVRHKPRIHIRYCSLRCWAMPDSGHEARHRDGEARRARRYWAKTGNKSPYLTEMRSIRARRARQTQPDLSDPSQLT